MKRPQTNGIVGCTAPLLDEHLRMESRRTWFETTEEIPFAIDGYLKSYNESRLHEGRSM